jgi:hypothetical protein
VPECQRFSQTSLSRSQTISPVQPNHFPKATKPSCKLIEGNENLILEHQKPKPNLEGWFFSKDCGI